MSTKKLLLDSIASEIRLIRFLGAKTPADKLDYRPSPGQRSALELLQYLATCGIRVAAVMITGDASLREKFAEEMQRVTLGTFDAAMAWQGERLRSLVEGIPERDLFGRTVKLPWGEEMTVAALLLNTTIKFLAAYRMQLFLYLKAMGRTDLGTSQLWRGVDPPKA